MPESGVTKHNYFLCQFINPAHGHKGERCDCYDTPSQKRTTLAKQRLIRLRANWNVNRASTSGTTESAVASNPAVTADMSTGRSYVSLYINSCLPAYSITYKTSLLTGSFIVLRLAIVLATGDPC